MRFKTGCLSFMIVCALLFIFSDNLFAQYGRIIGKILDENGNGAAGIIVEAQRLGEAGARSNIKATTDEKGEFTLSGMLLGNWLLTIEAEGYLPIRSRIWVGTRNNDPIEYKLSKGVIAEEGGPVENPQEEAKAALKEGTDLMDLGNYDEAIEVFGKLLNKYPTVYLLNLYIGDAFLKKGDTDNAINAFLAVLDEEENAIALQQLGKIFVDKKDFKGAKDFYDRLVLLEPANMVYLLDAAKVSNGALEYKAAIDYYTRYLATDPKDIAEKADALLNLGFLQSAEGNNQGAIDAFEKLLEMAPNHPLKADIQAEINNLKAK